MNHLFKGSMWHVDGTHNTIITTGNGGSEPTKAQVTLVRNANDGTLCGKFGTILRAFTSFCLGRLQMLLGINQPFKSYRWTGATLTLMLAAVSFPSAFAQKVTVEFDRGADFGKYKTFAIRSGQLNSRDSALNNDLVKKQIEADIAQDLTARGLTQSSQHADLNVVYRFGSARKVEVETYPVGWYGRGRRAVRVPYAEGTLVIDLRDTATHSLVWRALASEEKNDATKIEGKLDDMVKKSLEKYPPKQK